MPLKYRAKRRSERRVPACRTAVGRFGRACSFLTFHYLLEGALICGGTTARMRVRRTPQKPSTAFFRFSVLAVHIEIISWIYNLFYIYYMELMLDSYISEFGKRAVMMVHRAPCITLCVYLYSQRDRGASKSYAFRRHTRALHERSNINI